jgi:hypothetical protein
LLNTVTHFDFVFVPCHSDAASAVNATFHAFVDNEMLSAASDVLCAAFNESNGVYMAEAGLSHALVILNSQA